MDKHTNAALLARLGAAYSRTIEKDQLVVFYAALGRYSNEAVTRAVELWIETQERFPTPAQIVSTTQSVLRVMQNERADTHGLSEQSEQQQPELPIRQAQARAGVDAARAALAVGEARKREQQQRPEGDTEDD